jgi:hypothetical protein
MRSPKEHGVHCSNFKVERNLKDRERERERVQAAELNMESP